MTDPTGAPAIVAGWYPDPTGRYELRYHNGATWTADVSSDGARFVDPRGTAPSPVPSPTGGSNGPAVAAMVLGIVSIGIGWVPFVVAAGIVASVLAIALGIAGRRRARRTGTGSGYALAGLITGLVGALVCVGGVLFTIAFVEELDRFSNPAPNEVEIVSCSLDGPTATAEGRITNLGSETADFSIKVDFVRPGTNNPDRQARVPVDDLAPGSSAPFTVSRPVSLGEVDCLVASVDGPLPFGVDVD